MGESKHSQIEFTWGKRRGIGGKKKDVQFYESFTYDGDQYTLYDSVYLYKDGETEPFVGKIIKIWENADKSKKVKILWFFRPCEIQNFIGPNDASENELFLASGVGQGLANVNPLDRSKWFKGVPWEERIQDAHGQGRLVLLQNLNPSLTSAQVEEIIWDVFKERCSAKMIQRTAFSTPHSGKAYVILKSREAAENVVRKLHQGCLMANGRPLVGTIGQNPCLPEKKQTYYGHLVIDQIRLVQRETKDVVCTSHPSQPNNIEFDMAMEWCLLQGQAERALNKLYQRQQEEMRRLQAKLKSKWRLD